MVKDADWFDAHLPGWRQSAGMRLFGTSLPFHNGASHQRLRKAMAPAFSPARLRCLGEVIRTAVDHHLNLLAEHPHGDVVALHGLLTLPVTHGTVCALVGVPEADGPQLHDLVQPLLGLIDPEVGPRALMTSPARAAVATGEPAAVDAAVSEALRLASPIRLITRIARCDVTVGGVHVPAGQEVMALIAEAHRDPEHFPDAETFEPGRPESRLLAFGGGPHYCLGAQLARLEASLVLPALLRRFPRMAAAGSPHPNQRVNARGWTDLPCVLDP